MSEITSYDKSILSRTVASQNVDIAIDLYSPKEVFRSFDDVDYRFIDDCLTSFVEIITTFFDSKFNELAGDEDA